MPISACMAAAIKQWRFPAYSGAQMAPIDFPFKFDSEPRELLKRAEEVLAAGDYGRAATIFRKVLALDPNNRTAHDGLADIARRANDTYLDGYVLMNRDPDAARRKFQEVLKMVDASSDLAGKAKKMLAALGSTGP